MAVLLLFLLVASAIFFVIYETKLKSLEDAQGRTIVISIVSNFIRFIHNIIQFILISFIATIRMFAVGIPGAVKSRPMQARDAVVSPRATIIRPIPPQKAQFSEFILKIFRLPSFFIDFLASMVAGSSKVIVLGIVFVIGGIFKLLLLVSHILAEVVARMLRRLRMALTSIFSAILGAIERSILLNSAWFERVRAGLARLNERGEVKLSPMPAENVSLKHFLPVQEAKTSVSAIKVQGGEGLGIADLLYLAIHTFVARPMRTFLTILGMSVGLGTVLLFFSLGYGLQEVLLQRIANSVGQAQTIFRILQITLAFFGIAALIVSAIGMFNAMTISLLERTNEIGILKALGATQNDIRKMFLAESFLMGFLGGAGGLAIGYGLGYLVNIGMGFLARALGGDVVNIFSAPLWFVGLIFFISPVVGILIGFWPAQRAAAMNPLTALKYK